MRRYAAFLVAAVTVLSSTLSSAPRSALAVAGHRSVRGVTDQEAPSPCKANDTPAANGIAVDTRGNVYVAQGNAYTSPGSIVVEKWSPAGTLLATWRTPGAAPGSQRYPYAISVTGRGNIYLVDPAADRIDELGADGNVLAQWGRKGHAPGQLDTPVGVAVDRKGNVFVADRGNYRVQKFSGNGKLLAVWGKRHKPDAPGLFVAPTSIAIGAHGKVYVADDGNRLVTLSSRGKAVNVSDLTKGSNPGEFRHPDGIAIDGQETLYVGDKLNCRIQKLSSNGRVQVWQLEPISGQPASPTGLALDPQGNVYALEVGLGIRVQRFSPSGNLLGEWEPAVGSQA